MRIGIIICDRYRSCEGGKCFRAVRNRHGAFRRYSKDEPLEVVAYSTCGGCPGGNVETVVSGMKKNGAEAIHFATGVLAGYPPCPYLQTLVKFTEESTGLPVIVGTHPMPMNYIEMHKKVGDWGDEHWKFMEKNELLVPEEVELYDSSKPSYTEKLEEELKRK